MPSSGEMLDQMMAAFYPTLHWPSGSTSLRRLGRRLDRNSSSTLARLSGLLAWKM